MQDNSGAFPADYDNSWKEILDQLLPNFMQLFFPAAYQDIDWQRGFEPLEQELRQTIPEAETGKQFVDKFFKVHLHHGEETRLFIHIEIQSQRDLQITERIYIYNCTLFLQHRKPVISIVVYGDSDPNWKPDEYCYTQWDFHIKLKYPVIKLLDYQNRIEELKASKNPFAYFVIAHLKTIESKGDSLKRLEYKESVAKEAVECGAEIGEIRAIIRCIDIMMRLPFELEREYLHRIHTFQEEKNMPVLAPFEEIAMEEGMKKGIEQGIKQGIDKGLVIEAQESLLDILRVIFGEFPNELVDNVKNIHDLNRLRSLRKQALTTKSLQEFERFFNP